MSTLLDLIDIWFGEEATPGTENTTYEQFPGRVTSMTVTPENEEIAISDIGTRDEADFLLHGKENFPFDIEMVPQNWKPLYWAFGAVADSGAGPYDHAITLNNTIPSLSIEVVLGDGDFSIKLIGTKVDTFVLTFVAGEAPKLKITGMARSGTVDATPGTPTKLSTVPFQWHQTSTFTVNAIDRKSKVERAQYEFKNNLSNEYDLSQRNPSEILEGPNRSFVANYTIRAVDETLVLLRENYTDFAISHVITRDTNDTLTITIPSAKTMKPEKSSSGGGGATKISLPCKAQAGAYTIDARDSVSVYTNPA